MSLSNPFTPGTGTEPPHMAGRDPEHKLLKEAMAAITGPRQSECGPLRDGPPPILKIVGPRGVGKTALLTWTGRKADALKVDSKRLAYFPSSQAEEKLSSFLSKMADIPGFDRKHVSDRECKLIKEAQDWEYDQPLIKDFEEIMKTRLRFRPLMLLMDEVMHYDLEVLGKMLHHSQVLIDEGWPLAVVLAGIPTLDAHLEKVDARFVYRTKDIYINRLDPAATRAAVSRPFTDRDVSVTDDALELMVSWTDNYSYFTQVVGDEAWDAKEKAGCAEIDVALVQGVEQEVWRKRLSIYGSIYSRLDNSDELLEQARKVVATIEAAPEALTLEQVCACMAEGTDLDAKGAMDVYNQLLHAGLLWTAGDRKVHAALPSFFDYFKKMYEREFA